jgi:hypothetical protein
MTKNKLRKKLIGSNLTAKPQIGQKYPFMKRTHQITFLIGKSYLLKEKFLFQGPKNFKDSIEINTNYLEH